MQTYITAKIKQHGKRGSRRVGTMVALKDEASPIGFKIGWSLCCPKDKFDSVEGLERALVRAFEGTAPPMRGTKLLRAIAETTAAVKKRAHKYFRTSVEQQKADGIYNFEAVLYIDGVGDREKITQVWTAQPDGSYEGGIYTLNKINETQFTLTKV